MFAALKSLFSRPKTPAEQAWESEGVRVAVAALLLGVAEADAPASADEYDWIKTLTGAFFDLAPRATAELLDKAAEARATGTASSSTLIDLLAGSGLNETLRARVLTLMWDIALVDTPSPTAEVEDLAHQAAIAWGVPPDASAAIRAERLENR